MDPLSRLLPRTIARLGLTEEVLASHIVDTAQSWFAEHIPNYAHLVVVERFTHGVLFVSCSHSAVSDHCFGRIEELKSFLEKHIPDCHLEDIRLERAN